MTTKPKQKSEATVHCEIKGVKQYKDPNYKDPEPIQSEDVKDETPVQVKEVTPEEEHVMIGQTVVKPIKFDNLSKSNQKLIRDSGKGWITRNSQCPCGSGRRFKLCCMELVK